MGWRDAPEAQPGQPAAPVPAAPQRPYQQAPTVEQIVNGMDHQQMVDYYRTSKRGDPVADLIEQRLSQPMQGESPEDTQRRLYGHMDTQFSGPGAMAAGWADGAASGGADEIAGGIGAVTGQGYGQSLAKAREALRVAGEEHPWWYGTGTVLGGLTQGLVAGVGAAAPAAQATNQVVPQVTRQVAPQAAGSALSGLGRRMATGAAVGSGQSGAYTFLSGEGGAAERMKGVPMAAGIGAGLGALFPAVASGIGYAKGRWADRGLDQQALGKIADMLDETVMSPEEARAVAAQQGKRGMIADLNPGMQVNAGGTSAAGAAGVMTPPLKFRRETAKPVVGKMLDEAFGPYTDPQTVADLVKDARQPAGAAYELAKQHVVDPEDALATIDDLIKTFSPKSDVGQSLTRYKNQLVDDAGNVIGRGNIVHGVRMQLDDEINALYRAGKGGAAGKLKLVRDKLDEALKTQVPGFKEADKLWADTAKIQDAYDYGKDQLLGKVYPGQDAARLKAATDPENVATLAGARDSIEMSMAQPSINPALKAERILSSNMNEQKLGARISPERAARLAQGLDNEQTFLETSNLVEPQRNSRTMPIGKAAERFWGTPGKGTLTGDAVDLAAGTGAGFALGGPGGAAAAASGLVMGKLRGYLASLLESAPNRDLVNMTGDLLTRQGAARDQVLEDIIKRAARKALKAQKGKDTDLLVRTLLRGLPGPLAQSVQQLRDSNTGDH